MDNYKDKDVIPELMLNNNDGFLFVADIVDIKWDTEQEAEIFLWFNNLQLHERIMYDVFPPLDNSFLVILYFSPSFLSYVSSFLTTPHSCATLLYRFAHH